jgi:hypothetical protein
MEVMSGMGALVLILAVIVAVFAFDYSRGKGWTGVRSL